MLNLVKCLTGHPSLTSLRVYSKSNLSKLCSNVAAALPELPALEELDLDMVGHYRGGPHPSLSSRQQLMQAIRPHSTPHLSRLQVRFFRSLLQLIKENDHCLHNWLHSESVQEMLAANRGLRLRLITSDTSWISYNPDSPCCKFCLLGCHSRPYYRDPTLSALNTYEFSYLSFRDSNSSA
ncbi:uncharacterized protein LOC127752273 [Frankliniella occidentalis]|uniref:Uncharacterized protein LOC127752273 n=1 Tax=Frankliniella occidentalis TaxID=133901 RepID=A0A9C6XDE3_FRAOC|nr:uncharacterized protein LOC127752273 [Frankliniella occidentalis]